MNQIRDCREGTWQFGWAKTCMSLKDRTSQTTFKIAGKGTWDLVDLYTFIKELGTWRAQCKIVRKAQNEDKRLIYNERVIRRSHHPITETNEPNNMIVKSAEAQSSTHQKQTVLHSRWKCNLHSRNATDAWPALERWRPLMTSAVTLTIAPQMRHLSNYSMAPCIGDHPQQKTMQQAWLSRQSRDDVQFLCIRHLWDIATRQVTEINISWLNVLKTSMTASYFLFARKQQHDEASDSKRSLKQPAHSYEPWFSLNTRQNYHPEQFICTLGDQQNWMSILS